MPTRKSRKSKKAQPLATSRPGGAKPHRPLVNNLVHLFVDDQNLFWGIVNDERGRGFRIDFGRLLIEATKASDGSARGVKTAYIAGVIPDDDSFWKIASDKGFTVRRGYLGAGSRSKQDDAFLITDLTATLYEETGPSTIVLVAGDADYVPPLLKSIERGWRNEVAFIARGISTALTPVAHEFRVMSPGAIEYGR
jgi:uncharacterized LabA/DUF88 family protein